MEGVEVDALEDEEGAVWKSFEMSTFFFSFSAGLETEEEEAAEGVGAGEVGLETTGEDAAAGEAPSLTPIALVWPLAVLVEGGAAALASSEPNDRTAACSRWEPVTWDFAGLEERAAEGASIEPKFIEPAPLGAAFAPFPTRTPSPMGRPPAFLANEELEPLTEEEVEGGFEGAGVGFEDEVEAVARGAFDEDDETAGGPLDQAEGLGGCWVGGVELGALLIDGRMSFGGATKKLLGGRGKGERRA
jgi:hypothetical protein